MNNDPYMDEAQRQTNAWRPRDILTLVLFALLVLMVISPCLWLHNVTILPQIKGTIATLEALK